MKKKGPKKKTFTHRDALLIPSYHVSTNDIHYYVKVITAIIIVCAKRLYYALENYTLLLCRP